MATLWKVIIIIVIRYIHTYSLTNFILHFTVNFQCNSLLLLDIMFIVSSMVIGPIAFATHGIGKGKKLTSHPSVKDKFDGKLHVYYG